jgi:hypothetical protein
MSGVDEMSWDDMNKNHMVWPSVKEVRPPTDPRTRTNHHAAHTPPAPHLLTHDTSPPLTRHPQVRDYRRKVYAAVRGVIEKHPAFASLASAPTPQQSPFWSVVMGFEHERIHIETSSVRWRGLPHVGCAAWPHSPFEHALRVLDKLCL